MLKSLLNIFACPGCRGDLHLLSRNCDGNDGQLGIENGTLTCRDCQCVYPIADGVVYLKRDVQIRSGKNKAQWDVEEMQKVYKKCGLYKHATEFYEKMGYPKQVAEYDYPLVKGRLLEWLRPKAQNIILDVGCGVGYFLFEMMEMYPDTDVMLIGMDILEDRVRCLVHRKREEHRKNIIGIVGDGQEFPFKQNAIDIITCTEVLEHIFSPDKAIAEMARVLKPEGKILISTPSKRAEESWNCLTAPLRKAKGIIRRLAGKRVKAGKHYYDYPIYSEDLCKYIEGSQCDIVKFEQNVILPPQEYFKGMSEFLTTSVIKMFSLLEQYCRRLMAHRWALHTLVLAQKSGNPESRKARKPAKDSLYQPTQCLEDYLQR